MGSNKAAKKMCLPLMTVPAAAAVLSLKKKVKGRARQVAKPHAQSTLLRFSQYLLGNIIIGGYSFSGTHSVQFGSVVVHPPLNSG